MHRIIIDTNGARPHDAPITGGHWIRGPRNRLAVLLEALDCRGHGCAKGEASSGAAEVATIHPSAVAFHLIARIKPVLLDKAGGQAQSHRGVVGPFTCSKAEGTSAHHVNQWLEGTSLKELHGRTHRVPHRKTQQAATISVEQVHHNRLVRIEPDIHRTHGIVVPPDLPASLNRFFEHFFPIWITVLYGTTEVGEG